ncbi:GNAT family N-acetyltransferase [Methylovorus glucosotrophus]|uniref:N-acetyltransferase domain-containing protein n=1 Tax=Methylovorus glucosotrophus (strain SIP3-4) TaxID=582744 RepID=C6X7Z0_METGS|nr:GNAT family N-acetyltransferase [Methylovorus glucosotrophus]ACT51317.1 hypothetical protein Msip34_2075 [Methylovorus glucosotrophus SIP3-4]
MNMMTESFLKSKKPKAENIVINLSKINLDESNDSKEIYKWSRLFAQDYKKVIPFDENFVIKSMSNTKSYIIKHNGIEVGFIRLVNHGKILRTKRVFSLSCIYVKPEYRKQGIYKHVLTTLLKTINLYLILIDIEIAEIYSHFFKSNGFTYLTVGKDKTYLCHKKLK